MKVNNLYKITNNEDWNNLKEGENIVDISNDSYFGFRAMERLSKSIIYKPTTIDSLIRIGKESKKFSNTKHILLLDENELGYESKNNEEKFLKSASRIIEKLLELNPNIKIGFEIISSNDKDKIIYILNKIYKNNI